MKTKYSKIDQKYIFSSITQSTISLTYFQRASMLFELIKITKNYKLLPFINLQIDAARQGPALGVIPVLTPDHPCFSILLVFYHFRIPSLRKQAKFFSSSLPLGSIMPKQSSHSDRIMPCFSSAVVPVITLASLETLIFILVGSRLYSFKISKIVMKFIILVRLAIYLLLKILFPNMNLACFISYTAQLLAETVGMEIRIFALWLTLSFACSTEPEETSLSRLELFLESLEFKDYRENDLILTEDGLYIFRDDAVFSSLSSSFKFLKLLGK